MSVETPAQPDDETDETAEAPAARYQGDGSQFLSGVPARDLTQEEYDALDVVQREAVLTARDSSGALLYDVAGEEQPEAAPDAEPEPEPDAPTAAPAPEGEPEV